jgi:hypothetical protein
MVFTNAAVASPWIALAGKLGSTLSGDGVLVGGVDLLVGLELADITALALGLGLCQSHAPEHLDHAVVALDA